jgi:hypothetical protein
MEDMKDVHMMQVESLKGQLTEKITSSKEMSADINRLQALCRQLQTKSSPHKLMVRLVSFSLTSLGSAWQRPTPHKSTSRFSAACRFYASLYSHSREFGFAGVSWLRSRLSHRLYRTSGSSNLWRWSGSLLGRSRLLQRFNKLRKRGRPRRKRLVSNRSVIALEYSHFTSLPSKYVASHPRLPVTFQVVHGLGWEARAGVKGGSDFRFR